MNFFETFPECQSYPIYAGLVQLSKLKPEKNLGLNGI